MRVVFIGSKELVIHAARLLIDRGDEVVIIDHDKDRIENLSDRLDCGFLQGDATKPDILKEAAPEQTDVLFCLTGDDKVNIIAALIAKSIGFERVVPMIEDTQLEPICLQLGLKDTIIPNQTVARFLADLVQGRDILELSTLIKGEARFFSFVVDSDSPKTIKQLNLPEEARAICYYREGQFHLAEPESKMKYEDEVVILTHSRNLKELRRRWRPQTREEVPVDDTNGGQ